jgi:hypothetical protein
MNIFGLLLGHWFIHKCTDSNNSSYEKPRGIGFTISPKDSETTFEVKLGYQQEVVFDIETSGETVNYIWLNSVNYEKWKQGDENFRTWRGETNKKFAKVIIDKFDTWRLVIYNKDTKNDIACYVRLYNYTTGYNYMYN